MGSTAEESGIRPNGPTARIIIFKSRLFFRISFFATPEKARKQALFRGFSVCWVLRFVLDCFGIMWEEKGQNMSKSGGSK